VNGKAKCGQLRLAHLTETASLHLLLKWRQFERRFSSAFIVQCQADNERLAETPSMSSVSWHLCCCRSPQGTCDIQTNNYSENDKEPH